MQPDNHLLAGPLPAIDRPLGRHLGTAPGMESAIEAAGRIGCTAAQIFPGNPKGWQHAPLPPDRAARYRTGWEGACIRPLVIHAPYIINLASPEPALYGNSCRAIRNSLSRAGELGASFVVVHLGSHKGTGEEAGAARLVEAALAAVEQGPATTYLLLENNVGAGNTMGSSLEALGALVRAAAHPRIGVCIDTAHLWGYGYDLSSPDEARRTVDEVDRLVGLQHVRVLHLNDSPVPLGSHRDQHTYLGQGQIGYEGLAAFITHPALAGIPVVLETPDDGIEQEIVRLRTALLICAGDVAAARALQEAALPVGMSDQPAAVDA